MSWSPEQIRRYARHVLLPDFGGVGQKRLSAARVLVEDAGGAGAAALLYLAAAGVGTLVVTDERPVERNDLSLYECADLGRPRRAAVAERVAELNPDAQVVGEGAPTHHLLVGPAADAVSALEEGARRAAALVREIAGGA